MLADREKIALHDFHTIVQAMELSCLIVGAGARLLIFDWQYQVPPGRSTTDWDFAVKLNQWSDYTGLVDGLCAGDPPLFQQGRSEHRCIHISTETAIDIVPFGAIDEPDDTIVWPGSENPMNVMGYEEAFNYAEVYEIDGVNFRVVAVNAFIALKLLTWNDRHADKDLKDIDYILRHYLDTAVEKIYEDLGDELEKKGLAFEVAGPYHLGWQIAAIFPGQKRNQLIEIIKRILADEGRYIPRLIKDDSKDDFDNHYDRAVARLQALLQGIQLSAPVE